MKLIRPEDGLRRDLTNPTIKPGHQITGEQLLKLDEACLALGVDIGDVE